MASQATSTRVLRTRNQVVNYSGQTAAGAPAPSTSISRSEAPQKQRSSQKSTTSTPLAAPKLGRTRGIELRQGTVCSANSKFIHLQILFLYSGVHIVEMEAPSSFAALAIQDPHVRNVLIIMIFKRMMICSLCVHLAFLTIRLMVMFHT